MTFDQAVEAGWAAAAARNGGVVPAAVGLEEWIAGMSAEQVETIIAGLGESSRQTGV